MGALSSNNEIKSAIKAVDVHLQGKGCWVIDKQADNQILKDFFTIQCTRCIMRLKRNTKLIYKGGSMSVEQIAKKVRFLCTQNVTKIKKDKPVLKTYELAAIKFPGNSKGKTKALWLVISRHKTQGG